jgi:glycosyltransferase involved in cell wall biosynthesis
MNLSIALPTYEMGNKGLEFLAYNFKQLKSQIFKDLQVVVSDNSNDEIIKTYVSGIKDLDIKYVKNEGAKTLASNMNNAIRNCDGEIIQIMCQDDYFYNKYSLQKIVDNFDKNIGWMCSMYMHTKDKLGLFKQQIPKWNDKIYFDNTIGTPSCLSFLNNENIYFDENLTWLVDCEYYYRLFKKYGQPKILNELIFVQVLWEGQLTQTITQELINTETAYVNNKIVEINNPKEKVIEEAVEISKEVVEVKSGDEI